MSISFKKILLAGTALVAVATFSAQASAAVVPVTGMVGGIWSATGTYTQDGTLALAAAGDTIAAAVYLGTNPMTVTNNGTANDGSGLNAFSLGAIATNTAAGSLTFAVGSANDLAVTMATQNFTTTVGATTLTNAGQLANGLAVTYAGVLSTTGSLVMTNVATTAGKTVALTLNGAANVITTTTTVTGGVAAGADTVLTINGTGANALTGLVTLDDGVAGLAKLSLGSAVTAVTFGANIRGAAAGEGTLTIGGSTAITGTVGAVAGLLAVNAGANGTTSSISGATTATTTNITGTGTLAFGAAATTNVAFGGNDGVVTEAGGSNLTGTVDTTTASTGTLTLLGATTVSGTVGATQALKVVNAGVGASVFSSDVNATTLNNAASTVALNGNFTGTLNFTGDGTTTIAAAKSITGAVTTAVTNTGTVALAGAASGVTGQIGTSALKVKAVTIAGAGADTFGGDVFATTTTLSGASTVALNGSLTGTTLAYGASAGTVVLADNKDITAAITTTANTSILTLSGTSTITGQVGAAGAGNNLLTINAGVTGETGTFANDVFASTLAVGSGNVALNGATTGALLFNAASTGTVTIADGQAFTGAMAGTGGLIAAGVGNVVFGGSTTGVTTVNVGAANYLNSITINDGAAQKTVATGAFIAPTTTTLNDNVLAVTGAFTLGAGQTLSSTLKGAAAAAGAVAATNFGNVTATTTGGVTATSALNLTTAFTGYVASGASYKIIDAGAGAANTLGATMLTVNGVASVAGVATSGLMSYTQTADANDLIITVTRAVVNAANLGAEITANDTVVSAVLDTIAATGDDVPADGGLSLDTVQGNLAAAADAEEVHDILQSITPTVDGGAAMAAFDVGGQTQGINDLRMAAVRADDGTSGMAAGSSVNGVTMWLQGYGQTSNQDLRDGVAGYDANTLGGAIGVDTTTLMDNGVIGVAFNYGVTNVESDNVNTTDTDVDNYGVSLYTNYDMGQQMFLNAQLGYARNNIDITRHDAGGAGLVANGSTDSNQYSGKLALGRDYMQEYGMTVTPVVSAAYTYLDTDGYQETGTGVLNAVASSTMHALNVGIGGTASWKMKNADGSVMKPSIRAGYAYDVTGDRVETTSSFTGDPAATTFRTTGADPARHQFTGGVGMTYMTAADWDLSANYDYKYKTDYSAHSGVLRASSHF